MRKSGRDEDELRQSVITPGFITSAEGSALIEVGNTRVICTASIEDRIPGFLKDSGQGWVTAEYSLLPGSTNVRTQRESSKGKVGGRTHEIQRLIGRSMRTVVDMAALGERTLWIDCDVIQADGGTRTASITGAFVALAHAVGNAMQRGMVTSPPILDHVAAVSVGMVAGRAMLDLDYGEDFEAEVDMNVVMTGQGKFIEVQGTAERRPFDRDNLDRMTGLAEKGIGELIELQRRHIPEGVLKG
jgi:ribonuclease PH